MAERRMFAKTIIDSDAFLDMPMSTQALYFHLNMRADDDGFINNPRKIQRMIGASEDDLKLLIAKRFVLAFENGVIVIKHWKIHNYIRKDRYHPTLYQEEKQSIDVKEDGSYTDHHNLLPTSGQPDGNQRLTEDRLGKDRIGKDRLGKNKRFTPPSLEEAQAYCMERGNQVDAEAFIDFYTSKGWMVGKNPMKDWKACVRTWEKRDSQKANKGNKVANQLEQSYEMMAHWAEEE